MLILAKAVMAIMLGFSFSVVFGYFIIKIFNRKKISQAVSSTLGKRHMSKAGTPTMGGVIFIIPTIIIMGVLMLTHKVEFSTNLFIVLFCISITYIILFF